VERFRDGRDRGRWQRIVACVQDFSRAVEQGDWSAAAVAMNTETAIRREMTPDVLDPLGVALVETAAAEGCGGRFTGAGGGGCVWAVGARAAIQGLRLRWEALLTANADAMLLDTRPTGEGLAVHAVPRQTETH
jgi:D-glycero-alpha-D-manno-heptose-7-phosphate kinase